MKDFKSYSSEQPPQKPQDNAAEASNFNPTVEIAKILTSSMSGKSEGQILQNVIAEAERGKREGTLTNADLDNFYNALAPILDGMKKRKLKEVIQRLKNI